MTNIQLLWKNIKWRIQSGSRRRTILHEVTNHLQVLGAPSSKQTHQQILMLRVRPWNRRSARPSPWAKARAIVESAARPFQQGSLRPPEGPGLGSSVPVVVGFWVGISSHPKSGGFFPGLTKVGFKALGFFGRKKRGTKMEKKKHPAKTGIESSKKISVGGVLFLIGAKKYWTFFFPPTNAKKHDLKYVFILWLVLWDHCLGRYSSDIRLMQKKSYAQPPYSMGQPSKHWRVQIWLVRGHICNSTQLFLMFNVYIYIYMYISFLCGTLKHPFINGCFFSIACFTQIFTWYVKTGSSQIITSHPESQLANWEFWGFNIFAKKNKKKR